MREVIATNDGPKAIGPYSQAIKANGFVFVSGQIPIDPATQQLIVGDVAAQTERVLQNLVGNPESRGQFAGPRREVRRLPQKHVRLRCDERGLWPLLHPSATCTLDGRSRSPAERCAGGDRCDRAGIDFVANVPILRVLNLSVCPLISIHTGRRASSSRATLIISRRGAIFMSNTMLAVVKPEAAPGTEIREVPKPKFGRPTSWLRSKLLPFAAPTCTFISGTSGRSAAFIHRSFPATSSAASSKLWAMRSPALKKVILFPPRCTWHAASACNAAPAKRTSASM